jgi:4-amino-4-deoxy-L-arabinose transferase-like glycosyltransferase
MKRWRSLLPVVLVVCVALAVRMTYNLTVASAYTPRFDARSYESIALHILSEHCFCEHPYAPTLDRAPLWPGIIALLYALLGPHSEYVRLFLSLVGTGTCLLIFLFARDLLGPGWAILAGLIAALYPELYIYDGWLYSESLYIFLTLAFSYLLYRLATRQTPLWLWAGCGGIIALLALVRPNGLAALAIFALWGGVVLWQRWLPWRQFLGRALLTVLVTLALIAPWTLRNYAVSGRFVPIATGDGTVLLGAYNDLALVKPGYVGSWINPRVALPQVASRYPAVCSAPCEVTREDDFKQQAWQWIRSHLGQLPFLLAMHFANTWQPATVEADLPTVRFPHAPGAAAVTLMMRTIPLAIFALALIGLCGTLRDWRRWLVLYLVLVLTLAQCLLFYGSPRLRSPVEPVLILLAVAALHTLQRLCTRWLRRAPISEAAGAHVPAASPVSL